MELTGANSMATSSDTTNTEPRPVDSEPQPTVTPSALGPLRLRAFRVLWIAELVSNTGTWMQTVGAQWLLVAKVDAAILVSLVQVVDTLPDVAFGWLGGVLADTSDRRRLLIMFNLFLTAVGIALTLLTALGMMPAALLLTFTFLLGTASVVAIPAYQSLVNDIVPRSELPSAAALGSMNINLARAVGPAIAGLLIARIGVVGVFALNTLTFIFYAAVMFTWKPQLPVRQGRPEAFVSALVAGGRYIRHSPEVRRIFVRTALFAIPYSALIALLPVAATRRMGLTAEGYGLLLTALGIGAITGGFFLPRINARLSINQLVFIASLVLATAMVVVVLVSSIWPAVVMLVPAGGASIMVISNITASLQLFLPAWVRGRAFSVFQMVLFGSFGAGSLAFGLLANHAGVLVALLAAAAVMAVGGASVARWPFPDVSAIDRTRWSWPEPRLVPELEPSDEAVMITVSYTVPATREREFIAGMEEMRRERLSTGAMQWGLFRDAEAPQQFTEFFVVGSWEEHLRQHRERLTVVERELETRVQACSVTDPIAKHYLEARAQE
ncbi:MAG: MFS transporter [Gemmataceae bacterium]